MKIGNHIVLVCLLMLFVSGCTKRYWFRTKIDVPNSKKYSVQILIVNQSPHLLTQEYVDAMHKAAAKGLRKFGYFETHVKSPRFNYTLVLRVDSFNQLVKHYDNRNISNTMLLGNYNYRYGVGAIAFKARLDDTRYGEKWTRFDDIFFFNEKRDIARSAGVVKRLIKISEQKRYEY